MSSMTRSKFKGDINLGWHAAILCIVLYSQYCTVYSNGIQSHKALSADAGYLLSYPTHWDSSVDSPSSYSSLDCPQVWPALDRA